MAICDPACGTAGFLIYSAEYIREKYGRTMSSEQWENTQIHCLLATIQMQQL